jgi:hypothetical protein
MGVAQVLSQTQRARAARPIAAIRAMPDRGRNCADIGHVHQRALEAPARHHLVQELRGAVVGVPWRDDVLARKQGLEHGGGRRHAGREGDCGLAALQRGQRCLELAARGIVASRVDEPVRQCALGVAREGGGEMDGRGDRAGRGVGVVTSVDRDGLNAHGFCG